MAMLVLRSSLQAGCLGLVCLAGQPSPAADRSWELQGEFVALKPGESAVVVFRISGGSQVELPLAAFSESAQAAIRQLAKPGQPAVDTAPGLPSSPAVPPALAEDLAVCRRAADAADVCRLALAGPELTGDVRVSVEAMLVEFDERATRGESRLGGGWVGPEVAAQAAEKANGHIAKSLEMIRLGNLKLAEQELRQASQADSASGRADFLMGLAFMMGPKPDFDEAAKAFEEVVRREPANGAAWNNLAVCNVQRRRYPTAVAAFRSAAGVLADAQPVVGNLAIVIRLATDRRNRVSANQLDEVTSLYHGLIQGRGIAAPESIGGPVVLSPDGSPLAAGGIGELRNLLPPSGTPAPPRDVTGVVIAPRVVVCSLPGAEFSDNRGLMVVMPDGRNLPARVAAQTPDRTVVLVKCEGLDVAPLPVAARSAAAKDPITVVPLAHASGQPIAAVASPVQAIVLQAATGAERPRFVYEALRGADQQGPGDPGSVLLDAAGQVTGVGVRQPVARRSAGARRLALPAEAVWKLLGEMDPAIAPATPGGQAEKLSLDEAAARCRAAIVLVRAGDTPGTAP